MWQELLHNKYLMNKTLAQVDAKPTDNPFLETYVIRESRMLSSREVLLKWVIACVLDFGRMFGLGVVSIQSIVLVS
jgi:hypothetical protein